MDARARDCQKRAFLLNWITVCVFANFVRVRARIIMKINVLIYRYTNLWRSVHWLRRNCWNKNVYAFLSFLNVFLAIFQIEGEFWYIKYINTKIFTGTGVIFFQNVPNFPCLTPGILSDLSNKLILYCSSRWSPCINFYE